MKIQPSVAGQSGAVKLAKGNQKRVVVFSSFWLAM
jgi:hypothetical protein